MQTHCRESILYNETNESGEINNGIKVKIMQQNSILGGHRGMNKTQEAIRRYYQWPNMKKEVEEYVKKAPNVS
jgi:hypothetical protein